MAHSKVILDVLKFDQVKLFAKLFGTPYSKDNFSGKLWFCFLRNQILKIHGVIKEHGFKSVPDAGRAKLLRTEICVVVVMCIFVL